MTEPDAGLAATGTLEVPKGAREVRVELELEPGFSLEVLVRSGGAPAQGARISLFERSAFARFDRVSGVDGRVHFEGLSSGRYRISARPGGADVLDSNAREEIELAGDRSIVLDLPDARLTGTVRRSADRVPVAEAEVWIVDATSGGYHRQKCHTGPDGEFAFEALAHGTWLIGARKGDAAAPEQRLELAADGSGNDVELLLESASSLTLRVEGPRELWPERLDIVRLDAAGRAVATHRPLLESDGRARLESLPGGALGVFVEGPQFASVELGPVTPGEGNEVVVPLTPGCRLDVRVSGMPADGYPGRVRVVDATGRTIRRASGTTLLSEHSFGARGVRLRSLPAGPLRVFVDAGDGRTWEQEVTLNPAKPTRLDL